MKKIITLVLALALVVAFTACGKEKEVNGDMGKAISLGETEWTVKSMNTTPTLGKDKSTLTAKGVYVVLDLEATNNGKDSMEISDDFFNLMLGDDLIKVDDKATSALENQSLAFDAVDFEKTVSGKIVFDVSKEVAANPDLLLKITPKEVTKDIGMVKLG